MNEQPTINELEAALRGSAAAPPDPELDRLLAERAAEEGLLDVAYATVGSPLGELVVASTPRGLVRVAYSGFADDVLEQLARKLSPRVLEAPARLDAERRQLDEYFEGRRKDFDLPIDWAMTAGFTDPCPPGHRSHRLRGDEHLRRRGDRGRQPAGGACRGQRAGGEPDAGRGAVPPRAPQRRRARRLHRRCRAQGVPAAAGGRARLAHRLPSAPGRGGRVAEGTRLLSEYGGQPPSRVRIPPSPFQAPHETGKYVRFRVELAPLQCRDARYPLHPGARSSAG